MRVAALGVLAASVVLAAAGAGSGAPPAPAALGVRVVSTLPHDTEAFTEGLELDGDRLLESTGLVGRSSLRVLDPASGRLLRRRPLPTRVFGEGLTVVGDRILVLTWRDRSALLYDRETLRLLRRLPYREEGWGICFDGTRVVTSDGSSTLTFRDPQSLRPLRRVRVTVGGPAATRAGLAAGPVDRLNELECVGRQVYANVWQTDLLVRIDAASGQVTAVVRAGGLLRPDEAERVDVLNGIAYDAGRRLFLLTGKLWPRLFAVRLVARG